MTILRIRPSIILFGDSLTQQAFGTNTNTQFGWASLLSSTYSRRADVFNRGFSGYNTRHALHVFDSVFSSTSTEGNTLFCTIFFGANDATLPGERQHVPRDEYGDNVKQIVEKIRKRVNDETVDPSSSSSSSGSSETNKTPIILMTPPPVHTKAWETYCLETFGESRGDRSNASARLYGETVKSIGMEYDNVAVLDVWELLQGDQSDDVFGKYLSDGLHLSEEGNRMIHDGLMKLVKNEFPNLVPMLDGEGKYGSVGVPLEEKLWTELC